MAVFHDKVAQVNAVWSGLNEQQQAEVWADLRQSFEASKGKPRKENEIAGASWVEEGTRKETRVFWDRKKEAVTITVLCKDPAIFEPEKERDAAVEAF